MKIIKRNGSEATFDLVKIIAAVTKANNVVAEDARMTPMQIRRIAESVENSCQGRRSLQNCAARAGLPQQSSGLDRVRTAEYNPNL